MEKGKAGKQTEAVFEYTPEPSAAQRPPAGVGKAGVSISGRGAAVGAPLRENETIDTSGVNVTRARELFFTREADIEEAEAEARAAQKANPRRHHQQAALGGAGGGGAGAGGAGELADQRCARLQVELSSMLRIAEHSPPDVARELLGGDPAAIAAELRALEQRLRAWRKSSGAGGGAGGQAAAATTGGRVILDQLDRLVALAEAGAGGAGKLSEGAGKASGDERMVFEVNYMPSVETASNGSRLAALESSLADMASKIGAFDAASQHSDLQRTMSQVHARLSLLDVQKLETLRTGAEKARLGLEACLTDEETARRTADPEADEQVRELYDHCHRSVPAAAALPSIVMRLQSLQALHQLNASFVTRLASVEMQQEELTKVLEVTNCAIREMQVGLKENMTIMQANLASLDVKLSKAMAK